MLTGAAGAAIALLTARWLVLDASRSRLSAYANELIRFDETLAVNITGSLAAVNESTLPACSEPELMQMRRLLFRSDFLKDIGRLQNQNNLVCSAVGGVLPHPVPFGTPDLTTDGGRKIFYNHPLPAVEGYKAQTIQNGDAFVVVNPNVFTNFNRPPLYYAGYIRSIRTQKRLYTYTNFPAQGHPDYVPVGKYLNRKGTLYYSACSNVRPDCVVVGIADADVLQPNNRDLLFAAVEGALAGSLFCIATLILRRKWGSMAWRLQRAILKGDLRVVYQPIIDLSSGRIVAAEALSRWADQDGCEVSPDHFVALAEERGFIHELTCHVLRRTIDDLPSALRVAPSFRISVNLSAHDLSDAQFAATVDDLLRKSGIATHHLSFELTERSKACPQSLSAAIRELRRRGHMIYIDDFGTGYSSLAYLKDLTVDVVKVDRVFTQTIANGSIMASIVPQILSMAESLGLAVVVEGIETQEQMDYLGSVSGRLMGQGYLLGMPMPLDDLVERLKQQN